MYKAIVYKTLVLITQVGISVLVPIFFMLFVTIFIKNRFEIDLVLCGIIIGVVVGIRNSYMLLKKFIIDDKNTNSEMTEKFKKNDK